MKRLIDAEAFKVWLLENSLTDAEIEESKQIGYWIDEFPTAKMEPEWIQCIDGNEPKPNTYCWVSLSDGEVVRASYAPQYDDAPNGFIQIDDGFGFYPYEQSAIAWMPYFRKPKPYIPTVI